MRADKFLKVSRLIKRRTVANEACDDIDTGCIQSIVDKYKGRLRINIGEKTIWKLYPVHKNSLAEADIDGCMELLKGMQILKKA